MPPARCLFLGTAELARTSLRALIESPDVEVAGVISQPDRPRGRKLRPVPTAVRAEALEHGLQVWQPDSLGRDEALIGRLRELAPDLIVTAAYGQLLPPSVLSIPVRGALNVHTSLLPLHRGAAPIAWAILKGESRTGVTIMLMDEGLDTGPVLAQVHTPIGAEETGGELHDRLAILGADLLVRTIPRHLSGEIGPRAQDSSKATHAPRLSRRDGAMRWNRSAVDLANHVRGLAPWPGSWTRLERGERSERILLWRARAEEGSGGSPGELLEASAQGLVVACGQGRLRIGELQRAGSRRMEAAAFLSGCPLRPGMRFAEEEHREQR